MINAMPAGLGQPLKPFIEPLTKFNQLTSWQIEDWVALSMDSVKAYVDLGMAQVKVVLKVHDTQSLSEFADSQFAVLSFVGHRMLDDSRVLNEWGTDYCNQASRLARSSLLKAIFK
jgi:phasin family protein